LLLFIFAGRVIEDPSSVARHPTIAVTEFDHGTLLFQESKSQFQVLKFRHPK
jgi:hypothetical protein